MAFLLKEIKEILMALRSGENYHKDKIKFHQERLKHLEKDINMYQTKIANAIGRRQDL
jgi:hypothetical protein